MLEYDIMMGPCPAGPAGRRVGRPEEQPGSRALSQIEGLKSHIQY